MGLRDADIVELLEEGKLFVSPYAGIIWMRHECDGEYRRVPHRIPPPCRTLGDFKYPQISVRWRGKVLKLHCHRVVGVSMHGPNELDFDHKDGDRDNFRITNLEAVTPAVNIERREERNGRDSKREEPF